MTDENIKSILKDMREEMSQRLEGLEDDILDISDEVIEIAEKQKQNHIELMDEVTELRLSIDNVNWLEVHELLNRALELKSLDQLIFDAISKGKPLPYLADPTHYGLKDKDE